MGTGACGPGRRPGARAAAPASRSGGAAHHLPPHTQAAGPPACATQRPLRPALHTRTAGPPPPARHRPTATLGAQRPPSRPNRGRGSSEAGGGGAGRMAPRRLHPPPQPPAHADRSSEAGPLPQSGGGGHRRARGPPAPRRGKRRGLPVRVMVRPPCRSPWSARRTPTQTHELALPGPPAFPQPGLPQPWGPAVPRGGQRSPAGATEPCWQQQGERLGTEGSRQSGWDRGGRGPAAPFPRWRPSPGRCSWHPFRIEHSACPSCVRPHLPCWVTCHLSRGTPGGASVGALSIFFRLAVGVCGAARAWPCGAKTSRSERRGTRVPEGRGARAGARAAQCWAAPAGWGAGTPAGGAHAVSNFLFWLRFGFFFVCF